MAYRDLVVGDHVRVVGNDKDYPWAGFNAQVIETGSNLVKIRMSSFANNVEVWMRSEKLLVLHDPMKFIIDGKLDEHAKAIYDAERIAEMHKQRESSTDDCYDYDDEDDEDDDEPEPCGTCACCEAHNR